MSAEVPALVPARMLNEHVYCPRLAYLEWVDQGFRDSGDTVEGRFVHRRVERERGGASPPDDGVGDGEDAGEPASPSTSVTLSSESLGLIATIDLLEFEGQKARPVEYKRGRPRSAEEPLWEPELVQLCAQVLLLRDAGYEVNDAEVYFAETRTRHRIEIDGKLVGRTKRAIDELRETVSRDAPPPPLVDSPKCPRCSLVGICLPDEVNHLRGKAAKPRRLVVGDPPATPLYLTTQGSHLSKRGGRAVLFEAGEKQDSRRLIDISHLAVFGNGSVSSALLRELFDRGVPVLWLTYGGWLSGMATGMPPGNVEVRIRQHRAAALGAPELPGAFVSGKIRNCRTLLRRNAGEEATKALGQLARLARDAATAESTDSLLGLEGTAARIYFGHFGSMLAKPGSLGDFAFAERTRRPPRDRTNALLSFLYAMLTKDAVIAAFAAGLDPYVGLFHRPRFGRPALALDLAEEFRPLLCDSTVLTVVNNGEIDADDFVERAGSVALTAAGRRKVIQAYERRMTSELRHPVFGYRASYRRTMEIQARLLAGVLVGDSPEYRPLTTR